MRKLKDVQKEEKDKIKERQTAKSSVMARWLLVGRRRLLAVAAGLAARRMGRKWWLYRSHNIVKDNDICPRGKREAKRKAERKTEKVAVKYQQTRDLQRDVTSCAGKCRCKKNQKEKSERKRRNQPWDSTDALCGGSQANQSESQRRHAGRVLAGWLVSMGSDS